MDPLDARQRGSGPRPERALVFLARCAAGAGATGVVLILGVLAFVVSLDAAPVGGWLLGGFTATCLGLVAWVAAQRQFTRWVLRRRDDAHLLTTAATGLCGIVSLLSGLAVVTGSIATPAAVLGACGTCLLVELLLVTALRGSPSSVPTEAERATPDALLPAPPGSPSQTTWSARLLRTVATTAVLLGVAVGALAVFVGAVNLASGDPFGLFVALPAMGVLVLAAAWTLAHVALLWSLGTRGVLARPWVVAGTIAIALSLWRLLLPTEADWSAVATHVVQLAGAMLLVELPLLAARQAPHARGHRSVRASP